MKFLTAITTLLLSVPALATTTAGKADKIRVQSWNLRYDSKPNSITVNETIASLNSTVPNDSEISYYSNYQEVPWSSRRIGVANDFLFNQEALHRQVTDLAELLPDFEWVGVGRDDGVLAGEFEAIFYRKKAIKLLDWDTFWLSDTPFEPSKYPGAGSYRVATVAKLRTKAKSVLTGICTHWDDQSDTQRQLAASLIRYRGAYEAEKTNSSVLLFGDFNSKSSGDTSGGYQIITGETEPLAINSTFASVYNSSLADTFVFEDLLHHTPPQFRMGHHATFDGFYKFGNTQALGRIDFQMGGSNGGWNVTANKVGEIFYDNEFHLSDHRPVVSDIIVGYTQ